jgi:hypothetical protein
MGKTSALYNSQFHVQSWCFKYGVVTQRRRASNETFLPYFDVRETSSRMPISIQHHSDVPKINNLNSNERMISLLDGEPRPLKPKDSGVRKAGFSFDSSTSLYGAAISCKTVWKSLKASGCKRVTRLVHSFHFKCIVSMLSMPQINSTHKVMTDRL